MYPGLLPTHLRSLPATGTFSLSYLAHSDSCLIGSPAFTTSDASNDRHMSSSAAHLPVFFEHTPRTYLHRLHCQSSPHSESLHIRTCFLCRKRLIRTCTAYLVSNYNKQQSSKPYGGLHLYTRYFTIVSLTHIRLGTLFLLLRSRTGETYRHQLACYVPLSSWTKYILQNQIVRSTNLLPWNKIIWR